MVTRNCAACKGIGLVMRAGAHVNALQGGLVGVEGRVCWVPGDADGVGP